MSVIGTRRWQQLKKLQVTSRSSSSYIARVVILLSQDRILISPPNCSHLYIFDCKGDNWQTYQWPYGNFEYHVMCLSNDKTKLIVYAGYHQTLVIIDIDTMNIIKTFEHLSPNGGYPSVIPDPQNDELIHIIGGSIEHKHRTINFISGEVKHIHCFPENYKLGFFGIVYVKHKNVFLIFSGRTPMHSYDLNMKAWTDLDIKMPRKAHCFGYIMTHDQKYILSAPIRYRFFLQTI